MPPHSEFPSPAVAAKDEDLRAVTPSPGTLAGVEMVAASGASEPVISAPVATVSGATKPHNGKNRPSKIVTLRYVPRPDHPFPRNPPQAATSGNLGVTRRVSERERKKPATSAILTVPRQKRTRPGQPRRMNGSARAATTARTSDAAIVTADSTKNNTSTSVASREQGEARGRRSGEKGEQTCRHASTNETSRRKVGTRIQPPRAAASRTRRVEGYYVQDSSG